jgi:hypothetical protein
MSDNKDLKQINIKLPEKLTEYKDDVETLLKRNEAIIEKYLEDVVFVSSLTKETKQSLDMVFKKVRKNIMDKI